MYEKPQYFTADGYKRLDKNPHSNVNSQNRILSQKNHILPTVKFPQKGQPLSDEAAKMIANVLKGMLNERK